MPKYLPSRDIQIMTSVLTNKSFRLYTNGCASHSERRKSFYLYSQIEDASQLAADWFSFQLKQRGFLLNPAVNIVDANYFDVILAESQIYIAFKLHILSRLVGDNTYISSGWK